MKDKLKELRQEISNKLKEVKNIEAVKEIELKYFSRKGELNKHLKGIKDLSLDLKKELGALANEIKKELDLQLSEVKGGFLKEVFKEDKPLDLTLPGKINARGTLHPITILQNEIEDLFISLGFQVLDGPELESDYFNFTAINLPPLHPARDMQDTFYVYDPQQEKQDLDLVMRTHTSSVQVRSLKKFGAPLKAIIPGRCFRNESTDPRHEHTFYHLEGIMVGEDINFSNLKGVLELMGKKLFGENTELRIRPKYYPFVEPGHNGEFNCFLCSGKGCRVCKNSGWLEILGAGLIHPNVLRAGGVDPEKYSGFAFGVGFSRIAMLKYNINDVRLFNSGDIKFLEQF